jgi:hypothetical protein
MWLPYCTGTCTPSVLAWSFSIWSNPWQNSVTGRIRSGRSYACQQEHTGVQEKSSMYFYFKEGLATYGIAQYSLFGSHLHIQETSFTVTHSLPRYTPSSVWHYRPQAPWRQVGIIWTSKIPSSSPLHGIGEWYSQTISIKCPAAPFCRCEIPLSEIMN